MVQHVAGREAAGPDDHNAGTETCCPQNRAVRTVVHAIVRRSKAPSVDQYARL